MFSGFWILRSTGCVIEYVSVLCLVSMKSHHENEVIWNPGLSDSLRRGLRKIGNDIGKIRNWFVNSRPKILLGGNLENS